MMVHAGTGAPVDGTPITVTHTVSEDGTPVTPGKFSPGGSATGEFKRTTIEWNVSWLEFPNRTSGKLNIVKVCCTVGSRSYENRID